MFHYNDDVDRTNNNKTENNEIYHSATAGGCGQIPIIYYIVLIHVYEKEKEKENRIKEKSHQLFLLS